MAHRHRSSEMKRPVAATTSVMVVLMMWLVAASVMPRHAAADGTTVAITQPLPLASSTCPDSGNALFCYQPESVTTAVGGSVTFANQTLLKHTATVDGVFTTGDIPAGQSVSVTLPPGTYHYHCIYHQEKGTLVVPAPPTPAPTLVPGPALITGAGAAAPSVVKVPQARPFIVQGPRGSLELPPIDASPAPTTDLPPITPTEPSPSPSASPTLAPVTLDAAPASAGTDRSAAFFALAALAIIGAVGVLLGIVYGTLGVRQWWLKRSHS